MTTHSFVTETPAADPATAHRHFLHRLAVETDPSDVYRAMYADTQDFLLVDVRSPEAYQRSHAVGAINVHSATISAATAVALPKDKLLVLYCWGPGCNGATKAAVKLTQLGFQVKEMIGGIEYWEDHERYPVERAGAAQQ